jgi:hypothetical protein
MEFKYVSPKAVNSAVGKYAPVSSFLLARIIEEALGNANKGYVYTDANRRVRSDPPEISERLTGLADKLLAHSVARDKQHLFDFYSGLDCDFVHEHKAAREPGGSGASVHTTVKAYFHHTQYARKPTDRRVVFHLVHNEFDGTQWSISFPVQVVMKGFPSIVGGHVGYAHGIWLKDSTAVLGRQQHNYVGVTKRDWLKRMSEHFNEIRSGSNKTFHRAWRQYLGQQNAQLTSELVVVNHTFEQIMGWEEWAVDEQMNAGTSLNMIPGGFKGMAFLHKHRLTTSSRVTLEAREAAIQAYQARSPRTGIPNLLISDLWKNAEYAEQVICGPEGRLSAAQVRRIRELHEQSISPDKIVELVGAHNRLQVERVLSGETYSRIV